MEVVIISVLLKRGVGFTCAQEVLHHMEQGDSPVLEDLQSTDQSLQTQQVVAVSRYVDLVEDDVRRT